MNHTEYPYFVAPMIEALQAAWNEDEKDELRRLLAVNVGDKEALREIFQLNTATLTDFYPDMTPPDLSTEDTINSFLDHYGKNLPTAEGDQFVPIVPAIDYTASMIGEEPRKMRPSNPRRPATPTPEAPALSEGLARIMIKNGNYSKALEIITALNLKNPEKSVYFADQIRFLRKLIINEKNNKD